MSSTGDMTYAYSRHLTWGLAETTTAGLVFCVPAVPLAIQNVRRIFGPERYSLRSKIICGFFRLPLPKSKRRRWPHEFEGRAAPNSCRRVDRNRIYLTGPRPVKAHNTLISSHHRDSYIQNHGGILLTTEIKTLEETFSPHLHGRSEELLYPWVNNSGTQ